MINGKEYGYNAGEWVTNDDTLLSQSKKKTAVNVFGPKLLGHPNAPVQHSNLELEMEIDEQESPENMMYMN